MRVGGGLSASAGLALGLAIVGEELFKRDNLALGSGDPLQGSSRLLLGHFEIGLRLLDLLADSLLDLADGSHVALPFGMFDPTPCVSSMSIIFIAGIRTFV